MKQRFLDKVGVVLFGAAVWIGVAGSLAAAEPGTELDRILAQENQALGATRAALPVIDDLAYLRRVSVDLIGRIPTESELHEYLSWPSTERRAKVVDKLLQDDRFADRWTTFYGDFLRLRANAEGGALLTAYVKQSIRDGMPYDELCRRLISAGGRLGSVAEVGFVLGDQADPMALAGTTSQVFMGVRIACAQCHDHPFDVWTRKDFYGMAAFFGKTKRIEREFKMKSLGVYTTETAESTVMWPPEGSKIDEPRRAMTPTFPISLEEGDGPRQHVARFEKIRAEREAAAKRAAEQVAAAKTSQSDAAVDDLLSGAEKSVQRRTSGGPTTLQEVLEEARASVKGIDLASEQHRPSALRRQLAEFVTNPRNRYFSQSFCNRMWAELIGRGFVEPVDDFTSENVPNRPQALAYLSDEFVAHGYDLRHLVRLIVSSDVYRRSHASHLPEADRQEFEEAYLATPMRRMISEALYDSIVVAGHLESPKHEAGKNLKTVWRTVQVPKTPAKLAPQTLASAAGAGKPAGAPAMMAEPKMEGRSGAGYDVEKALELDFEAVLKASQMSVAIDKMNVKSAEEIEAERMQEQAQRRQLDYIERFVKAVFDDNPQFASSLRMAAPAPAGHFLQVFGQPTRVDLGDHRDFSPSMRQALLMLNGNLTHEASRVGELEPLYALLSGPKSDVDGAVKLAYREILTREPSAKELADGAGIVRSGKNAVDGMADLRWVLLNSNEFRFLP